MSEDCLDQQDLVATRDLLDPVDNLALVGKGVNQDLLANQAPEVRQDNPGLQEGQARVELLALLDRPDLVVRLETGGSKGRLGR